MAWAAEGAVQVINELHGMIDTGQFDDAYKLAEGQSGMQGNPHFDFLFGVAAIHSGHTAEGVLALERHLSAVPANDRARLELARGYYDLGDYPRARQEFEFVLRYNPPKEVAENIRKYLDLMQTREAISAKVVSHAYVEFGLGSDSNTNAGTYNSQFLLGGTVITLADKSSQANRSLFAETRIGGQWVKRVDERLSVFAGADADEKHNFSATEFDIASVNGRVGFSVLKGAALYRLTLSDEPMWVGNSPYRNTLSVTGEGQRGLGQGYSLSGVVQYAELSYDDDADKTRDSRMYTLGAGLQKTFTVPWQPTLGFQLTWGQERTLHLNEALDSDIYTARVSLSASPMPRLGLNGGLTYQQSDYQGVDVAFGSVRHDKLYSADLGVNYLWRPNWLLRADMQYTRSDSNQGLYPYRRTLVGLRTRYLF